QFFALRLAGAQCEQFRVAREFEQWRAGRFGYGRGIHPPLSAGRITLAAEKSKTKTHNAVGPMG
ncbi:MAG: hypothetical protein LUE92_13850, partial [Clostridiales bacterium]|nr:hypothetical protein [Clostridiales bacterium]